MLVVLMFLVLSECLWSRWWQWKASGLQQVDLCLLWVLGSHHRGFWWPPGLATCSVSSPAGRLGGR